MKQVINKIVLVLVLVVSCYSCNYLDIVPDENATEADAFILFSPFFKICLFAH